MNYTKYTVMVFVWVKHIGVAHYTIITQDIRNIVNVDFSIMKLVKYVILMKTKRLAVSNENH